MYVINCIALPGWQVLDYHCDKLITYKLTVSSIIAMPIMAKYATLKFLLFEAYRGAQISQEIRKISSQRGKPKKEKMELLN